MDAARTRMRRKQVSDSLETCILQLVGSSRETEVRGAHAYSSSLGQAVAAFWRAQSTANVDARRNFLFEYFLNT